MPHLHATTTWFLVLCCSTPALIQAENKSVRTIQSSSTEGITLQVSDWSECNSQCVKFRTVICYLDQRPVPEDECNLKISHYEICSEAECTPEPGQDNDWSDTHSDDDDLADAPDTDEDGKSSPSSGDDVYQDTDDRSDAGDAGTDDPGDAGDESQTDESQTDETNGDEKDDGSSDSADKSGQHHTHKPESECTGVSCAIGHHKLAFIVVLIVLLAICGCIVSKSRQDSGNTIKYSKVQQLDDFEFPEERINPFEADEAEDADSPTGSGGSFEMIGGV